MSTGNGVRTHHRPGGMGLLMHDLALDKGSILLIFAGTSILTASVAALRELESNISGLAVASLAFLQARFVAFSSVLRNRDGLGLGSLVDRHVVDDVGFGGLGLGLVHVRRILGPRDDQRSVLLISGALVFAHSVTALVNASADVCVLAVVGCALVHA